MLSAGAIRGKIKTAVESHAVFNAWYSSWNDAKELPSETEEDQVVWLSWHGGREREKTGVAYRTQFIQLLFYRRTASDHSADARDLAVEAADNAAHDIIDLLETDGDIEISDVNVTTRWDERSDVSSGVLLQFKLKDLSGRCLDTTHFQ